MLGSKNRPRRPSSPALPAKITISLPNRFALHLAKLANITPTPFNTVTQTVYPTTYLIPEWAEQAAVLLAWPYAQGDFAPWLPTVEQTYIHIAQEIAQRQTLLVACRNPEHQARIAGLLAERDVAAEQVQYALLPYEDVWVRDTAPLTVATPEGPKLLDFRFNGWGGKYPHSADAALAQNLHATDLLGGLGLERIDFVLEGGSVESDGLGTLLTTARCLLNPNRNPTLNQAQIEAVLRERLGAEKVLWVEHGHAEGDDTDAHIDTLVRFCAPDTLAYTACDDPKDPLYPELATMAAQLATFRSPSGDAYRLVPLPIPAPIFSEDGQRLPATYANFLIINGAVLVPTYGDPADTVALERLAAGFPGREIVAIDCLPLIRQYGSLHCMTMQFPR